MSYWVDVTPRGRDRHAVVRQAGPGPSPAATPSTVNVTMPHRSVPRSWTVHARQLGQARPQVLRARSATVGLDRRRCPGPARTARRRSGRAGPRRSTPTARTPARPCRSSYRSGAAHVPAVQVHLPRPQPAQHRRGAPPGTRSPAARAATCGPVPDDDVDAEAATSSGTWPTDWHASSSTSAPTSCAASTTGATGFTRPPFVGTWTSDTSRTRSSSIARSAATSTAPDGVGRDRLDRRAGLGRPAQHRDRVARVLHLGAPGCGRRPPAAPRRTPPATSGSRCR